MGRSKIGNRCLLVIRVSGWRREPVPPARRTPFMGRSLGVDGQPVGRVDEWAIVRARS